jgi:prefoldin beta subunit
MTTTAEDYQATVEAINENRRKMQTQVELLKKLTAQKSENDSVKKEFEKLAEDAVIWKQVGPLMVKQERQDAKANVDKRIEFINNDVLSTEEKIKALENEFEDKRSILLKLQEENKNNNQQQTTASQ